MPRRQGTQNKGGRLEGGSPARAGNNAKNAGHALSEEVREAIASLPQITSCEWSKSYLAEQVWRNFLGLPSDYSWADLRLIAEGKVIE
jgi:hypothetical protein